MECIDANYRWDWIYIARKKNDRVFEELVYICEIEYSGQIHKLGLSLKGEGSIAKGYGFGIRGANETRQWMSYSRLVQSKFVQHSTRMSLIRAWLVILKNTKWDTWNRLEPREKLKRCHKRLTFYNFYISCRKNVTKMKNTRKNSRSRYPKLESNSFY